MGGMWGAYVPVAKRRQQAEREVAKLRKGGRVIKGVTITGRTIATTFWGKAWCDNLESYRDYESRLPRGRTYVRNGSVIDLQIAPLKVTALVSGSQIYTISISVAALPKQAWQALCRDCAGSIDSLVELLQGRFSEAVMARLCRQDGGLFPKPSDIKFRCSCPDSASLCKHVAAALYGVGARLDAEPELLFRLRAVDEEDLLATVDPALPLSKTAPSADRVLAGDDLAALFGLDLAPPGEASMPQTPVVATAARVKKAPAPTVPAPQAPVPQAPVARAKSARTAAATPAPASKAAGGKPAPRPRLSLDPETRKAVDKIERNARALQLANETAEAAGLPVPYPSPPKPPIVVPPPLSPEVARLKRKSFLTVEEALVLSGTKKAAAKTARKAARNDTAP